MTATTLSGTPAGGSGVPGDGPGDGISPLPVPGPSTVPYIDGKAALYAALARVQAELPRIRKGETAKVTGETKDGRPISYEYTYANLGTIAEAIMPLLGRHGLAFTAWPTTRSDPSRFVLAYALVHEAGEQIEGEYPLPDRWNPQQLGSAITYGRRYCLCAVTGVAPDDQDDDGAAASHVTMSSRPNGPAGQTGQSDQRQGLPPEVIDGRNRVATEWERTFGTAFAETQEHYRRWTEGRDLLAADGAELRRYASFLATLPAAAAIGASQQQGEAGEAELVNDGPPGPRLTSLQRTRIQAGLATLYGKDRAEKLRFMSTLLDHEVKSSNDLTVQEAIRVIDALPAPPEKASAGAGGPVVGREEATTNKSGPDLEGAPPQAGPDSAPADHTESET